MKNNSKILNDSCMDLVAVDTTSAMRPPKPNNTIDFCCAANLPTNFKLAKDPNVTILYDLNNLFCKIEPKCPESQSGCQSCCQRFDIRVLGSIPFIANATVYPNADQCSTASPNCPIKISCSCVVPVNKVVCNVCSYEAAIEACTILGFKLRNCSCVTVDNLMATQGTGDGSCAVTFTGKFKLPDCNTPTSIGCPRA